MSRIRSTNTKPEMVVRRFLFSQGFRFRLHHKALPGKPDIVLSKIKTVVFIHGCFWHGHEGCKYFRIPQTRTEWWETKISRNKQRDLENKRKLRSEGWRVVNIFECDLKKDKMTKTLEKLVRQLAKAKGL